MLLLAIPVDRSKMILWIRGLVVTDIGRFAAGVLRLLECVICGCTAIVRCVCLVI